MHTEEVQKGLDRVGKTVMINDSTSGSTSGGTKITVKCAYKGELSSDGSQFKGDISCSTNGGSSSSSGTFTADKKKK